MAASEIFRSWSSLLAIMARKSSSKPLRSWRASVLYGLTRTASRASSIACARAVRAACSTGLLGGGGLGETR
jgi:hypothetical protein